MNPRACPFPGMDPWLESRWEGFHQVFLAEMNRALNRVLPAEFVAVVQNRVFVESTLGIDREVVPDLHLVAERRRPLQTESSAGGVLTAEPLLIHVGEIELTESFIEIIDVNTGETVVTVIELLSLSNKASGSAGRTLYVQKQAELARSSTHLVEIDFLRSGSPTTIASRRTPSSSDAAYHVSVSRAARRATAEYYPIALRDALPAIRVPLREGDVDCPLDLRQIFADAYVDGRYRQQLSYGRPPQPRLTPSDAEWAADCLRGAGR